VVSAFLTDGDNRVTISSRQPSFRTIMHPRLLPSAPSRGVKDGCPKDVWAGLQKCARDLKNEVVSGVQHWLMMQIYQINFGKSRKIYVLHKN